MPLSVDSRTTVTVTCEGPRCTPKSLSWVEEEVAKNVVALPDDAFRFVVFQSFAEMARANPQTGQSGPRHIFCSVRCEHDWQLQEYKPPRSPREISEEMRGNAALAEQQKQKDAVNHTTVPVAGTSVVGTVAPESIAVSQPDGFAEPAA